MTLGSLVQAYAADQCRVVLDGTIALRRHDEDAVHPTRVAIRRLRATLRTYAEVYRHRRAEHLGEELRWWAEILGRLRDLRIVEDRVAAGLSHEVPPGVTNRFAAERAAAWRAFDEAVAGPRYARLAERLARFEADPPFTDEADAPASAARRQVDDAAAVLRRRLRRAARAIERGDADADTRVHAARKAAKRHRYAVELARPVLGSDADRTHDGLRALQDALGERQDAAVTLAWLGEAARDLPDDRAALAPLAEAQRVVLDGAAAIIAHELGESAAD